MSDMGAKTCPRCGEAKPVGDYYAHPRSRDRLSTYCKKCHNATPRGASAIKINRTRARNRAVADLVRFHEDEFKTLLAIRLAEAQEEAEALAATPEANEHYKDEPVRLKPGKRMPGEKAGDRIDVARCPHCIKHHDRGHICSNCGATPSGDGKALTGGRWATGPGGVKRWTA